MERLPGCHHHRQGAPGKLRAAGERWASGGRETSAQETAEGLEQFGAPPELVADWSKLADTEAKGGGDWDLGIWPDCWDALRLFLAVDTQWRVAGMGGVPTGLDYAALPPALSMLGLAPSEGLHRDLQVIETAALGGLLQRWKR